MRSGVTGTQKEYEVASTYREIGMTRLQKTHIRHPGPDENIFIWKILRPGDYSLQRIFTPEKMSGIENWLPSRGLHRIDFGYHRPRVNSLQFENVWSQVRGDGYARGTRGLFIVKNIHAREDAWYPQRFMAIATCCPSRSNCFSMLFKYLYHRPSFIPSWIS